MKVKVQLVPFEMLLDKKFCRSILLHSLAWWEVEAKYPYIVCEPPFSPSLVCFCCVFSKKGILV